MRGEAGLDYAGGPQTELPELAADARGVWLHTLLWFYREYKERKQRLSQPHVRIDLPPVPAGLEGKHFQRFSRTWRIAHLMFALSLMVLTLTGIPLFYPDAPWAKPLMQLLGGPRTAGLIHRSAALVFASIFFWHLFYVGIGIIRNWKSFKVWGPNSLIPGPQDFKDIYAMFRWFFGKGPRPVFDRWTYWEKFDYWAPFWGVTIIGVSGLVMWFPYFATFLPGWVYNVAPIFHGEEAFLAVVFLFTVHFFNNHFRPDKLPPPDIVMFTGAVSLEEFKREHTLEFNELVASGRLKDYLVDVPSPAMKLGARILGIVLLACGLTLLTLVIAGFVHTLST